jgi:hypothetical protein
MRLSKMIGAVLVSSMLCAAPVGAQPVNDQLRATARALADEGMTFYEQRKYADALDRFDRASEIIQAPTISLHAARSLDKLGRLVEAAERYRTCINTPLDDKASDAFRAAQDTARTELQALTPRIPSIEIAVKGPGANEAIVTLDGRRVPKALIGVKTLVNPGEHKIGASTETHADLEEVTITEKQLSRVVLELEPKAGTNSGQETGPDNPVTPPAPMNKKRVGGFVALGVGGAFGVLGIGAGIAALSTQKTLERTCPQDEEPPPGKCDVDTDPVFEANYDKFTTRQALSTVGFVVGGVGIATGVVLLVLAAKSKPPPQPATNSLHIEPWIGANSAGFRGTF